MLQETKHIVCQLSRYAVEETNLGLSYFCYRGMKEEPSGNYVKYEDVVKLLERLSNSNNQEKNRIGA